MINEPDFFFESGLVGPLLVKKLHAQNEENR